jgi:peptide/nickel transport system substrate-binding protein
MAPDPSWATAWFVPAQIGIWNWERWNSPLFGTLHEAALAEMDLAKRGAMYVRMQELMEESGAYLFLTHEVSSVVYRDTIAPSLTPDARYILPDMKRA